MSVHMPHHQQDYEAIERLHSRFCGDVGDSAIALQDASYRLGRERGRLEANAALLEALQRIAGFTMSQFMGPHDMALECVNVASAAIAAATAQAGEQHG